MRSGFSLVELSIVLVILGLLTGGILAGQNLIRAAELRSVTTQFQNYHAAVMTFRDKYFALPGDMANAEDFWGLCLLELALTQQQEQVHKLAMVMATEKLKMRLERAEPANASPFGSTWQMQV